MLHGFGYLAPVPQFRFETDAIPLAGAGSAGDEDAREREDRRLPGQDGRETGEAMTNPRT